jgi:hypothetical protein
MGGLLEPPPRTEERDTIRRSIVVATVVLVALVVGIALIWREPVKQGSSPPPYAPQLQFSDLQMSQAQNFVGATVTYVDGRVMNRGNQVVTHLEVQVTFRDPYGQVAQIERVPLRILSGTSGYQDTIDLAAMPLAPDETKPFRLIFEHVSAQWNQAYPELSIAEVSLRQAPAPSRP